MSSTRDDKTTKLPCDLPKCSCFEYPDIYVVLARTNDVARAAGEMCTTFIKVAGEAGLCRDALMFLVEIALVSLLTQVAKEQGPALKYGSKEIEWEVERLLAGIEGRVLARSRDVYGRAREMGLTEEVVRAMQERAAEGGRGQ